MTFGLKPPTQTKEVRKCKLTLEKGELWFYPPEYSSQRVKHEFGGRWVFDKKAWRLPVLWYIINDLILSYSGVELSDEVKKIYEHEWGLTADTSNISLPEFIGQDGQGSLYPFQRDAIQYLLSRVNGGGLLGLSPGLGKTLVSIVAAGFLSAKRVLVVSPLSLLETTWVSQLNQWSSSHTVQVCHGSNPSFSSVEKVHWVITNYDTLSRREETYAKTSWDLLICDESILIKNRQTQRLKALLKLRPKVKRAWLLSGNPTSKFVDDLWSQFKLIFPDGFTSYWRFVERNCVLWQSPWGTQILENKDLDFRSEFRDLMFIRDQKEVFPQLPEFIYEPPLEVSLEGEQLKIYNQLLNEFRAYLENEVEINVTNRMSQITRLLQVLSNPRNLGPDWPDLSCRGSGISSLLDLGKIPLPLVIWGHYTEGLKSLAEKIRKKGLKTELVTGDTHNITGVVPRFQAGEVDVLVLSLGVGKFGHTLTRAASMVYYERNFDADAYFQSLHRTQRIGLDHSVVLQIVRTPNSAEELVERNLAGKMVSLSQISGADLEELLNTIHGGGR